jgi:hypothetical protein
MTITAKTVKEADKQCTSVRQSGYVFFYKYKHEEGGSTKHGIDCAEGDPENRMQEIQDERELDKIELIGCVYAKQRDCALNKVRREKRR